MKIVLQTMDHALQYKYAQQQLLRSIGPNDIVKIIIFSPEKEKDSYFKKIKKYKQKKKLTSLIRNLIGRILLKKYLDEFNKKTSRVNAKIKHLIDNTEISYTKVTSEQQAKDIISDFKPDRVIVVGSPFLSKSYFIKDIDYLNLHIGIIPKYRGLKCIEWAILNSDYSNIGFTIHLMTPSLDLGDIIFKEVINIDHMSLSSIYSNAYIGGINKIIKVAMQESLVTLEGKSNRGNLYYTIDFTAFEAKRLINQINI